MRASDLHAIWERFIQRPLFRFLGTTLALLLFPYQATASETPQNHGNSLRIAAESNSHRLAENPVALKRYAPSQPVLNEAARLASKRHLDPELGAALPRAPENKEALLETLNSGDLYASFLSKEEVELLVSRATEKTGIGGKLLQSGDELYLLPRQNSYLRDRGFEDALVLKSLEGLRPGIVGPENIARFLRSGYYRLWYLSVSKPGSADTIDLRVPVRSYDVHSVELWNEYDLPLIRILSFEQGETAKELAELSERIRPSEKPLVLDLRYNEGGSVEEAVEVASQFLWPDLPFASVVNREGRRVDYVTGAGRSTEFANRPIYVLVGPNTASSAELLARSLRIYRNAEIIGQRSMGKCVGQTQFTLQDGGRFSFTTHQLLDANGAFCEGKGISPDRAVDTEQLHRTRALVSSLEAPGPALKPR